MTLRDRLIKCLEAYRLQDTGSYYSENDLATHILSNLEADWNGKCSEIYIQSNRLSDDKTLIPLMLKVENKKIKIFIHELDYAILHNENTDALLHKDDSCKHEYEGIIYDSYPEAHLIICKKCKKEKDGE